MNKYQNHSERGVTIVELSIVILIIGLLIAAVTGGIKLKEAAELRNIMNDAAAFRIAMEDFGEKYQKYPGDLDTAYSYWGSSCDSTAANCNGNGDGNIDINSSTGTDSEAYRLWQHLNLAGFIEGSYTGIGTGDGDQTDPGINAPATRKSKGAYHIRTYTDNTLTVTGSYISAGGFAVNSWPVEGLLTPTETYSIDQKMDDGLADSGKVQGRPRFDASAGSWDSTSCISGTAPNRTYKRTVTNAECVVYFSVKP